MDRRTFLQAAGALGAGLVFGSTDAAAASPPFRMKYAPHFDQFRRLGGKDPLDQIRFMHDEGFRALEDNGMRNRPVELQEQIGKELDRLGMTMGVFVITANFGAPDFATNDPAAMEPVLAAVRDSLEVAKRVNAQWCTVVPGRVNPALDWDTQTKLVIDNLKRCAEICEQTGLIMVLEPLNGRDHPEMFLTKIPQAYEICKAVGSSSCKILDDFYHQQITEGDLIPKLDAAWDEIAYIQVGDNPGRKEPTTGQHKYKNIFKHLHAKGYTGVIGMEHGRAGSGEAGERAVIEAYRTCDSF